MSVRRTCVCCLSLIIALISVAIIAITIYVHMDFERIMENRVKSEMIIDENSVFYDNWLHSKLTERINIYVLEIVNPSDVINGMKPKVKEIGPFVFR